MIDDEYDEYDELTNDEIMTFLLLFPHARYINPYIIYRINKIKLIVIQKWRETF